MTGLDFLNNCGNCKFWEKTSDYSHVENEGFCKEIKEKIYIVIEGDGFLSNIETEEGFCCSLYETEK